MDTHDASSKGIFYDYLISFHKVARALGSTLSSDEVLRNMLENITATMKGKASSVMLIDEKSRELKHRASHGLSEKYLAKGPIDLDRSILDREKGAPILLKDATADERVQYRESVKEEGIGSILIVPIVVKEKVIGALQLYTDAPREFSEDEIRFLSSLAETGGLALENAFLYEQRQKENQAFWELGKSINGSLKLNEVLETMAKGITRALDLKGCMIRLLDEKRRVLELMASFGLSQKYLKKGTVDLDKSFIEPMEGKYAYVRDAGSDTRLQYPQEAKEEGIASILSVPMKVREKIVGVLRLYTSYPREFNNDEMNFINAIAELGGTAIENAMMYSRVKEDYDDLRESIGSSRSWF
ncbi:MAG: GAF domain-containing protein [Candidatus Eremiobacteraeota bacterium]|nr:GAF domain-containing protein [Candidatus Eremiobacteraeota bacterium]